MKKLLLLSALILVAGCGRPTNAARYRLWSEASTSERDRLANHAAKLDASLAEGREVVAEFRVALGQCQRDLKALGEQITLDRELIGE